MSVPMKEHQAVKTYKAVDVKLHAVRRLREM